MNDQSTPRPPDDASPSTPQRRQSLWRNARFGVLSLACLMLALITGLGMCLLPIGGTPRSDTYCDMIFYVPTMLLMAGSALGLMGIVLDRRKILAVIETILSLAMFFLILSVYPMFSGGPP